MVVKEYKKPAGVYKVQTFRTTHSRRHHHNPPRAWPLRRRSQELPVRECSFPEPFEVTNHTTPAQAGEGAEKCECEARVLAPAGVGARGGDGARGGRAFWVPTETVGYDGADP